MFIEIKERSMYDNLLFYFFHLKKCRIREHFLEMKKKNCPPYSFPSKPNSQTYSYFFH